jgi:hypothetical protein
MKRSILAFALLFCSLGFDWIVTPKPAESLSYNFTLIADTSGDFGPFTSLGQNPTINNAGTVSFIAGGGGVIRFLTGSGGSLTTIADSTGPISTFTGPAGVINDSGTVAFFATLDTGVRGIFSGNGGDLTTIATTGGALTSSFGFTPSINNTGTVAFTTGLTSGGFGVFTGSGGSLTTVATTAGAFNTLQNPDINNLGVVAFSGALDPGPLPQYVASGTGEPFTTIVQTGVDGFTLLGLLNVAINDSGTVAFRGFNPTGGIFTASGGTITPFADSSGALNIALSNNRVALNNDGDVAFQAGLDAGGECIFIGPDAVDDKVICQGDALFGSTIGHSLFPFLTTGNIAFFRDGLNDSGELTFWARLLDGREVIVRATPLEAAVPEPGSVLLVGLGLLGLLVYLKNSRV